MATSNCASADSLLPTTPEGLAPHLRPTVALTDEEQRIIDDDLEAKCALGACHLCDPLTRARSEGALMRDCESE